MTDLSEIANKIREDIIAMLVAAGSGHSAGPLGMADVFTAIYFSQALNLNPKNPWDPNRDRVLLSNGHICPVWYATLARAGYFNHDEILTLRKSEPDFKVILITENFLGWRTPVALWAKDYPKPLVSLWLDRLIMLIIEQFA